MTTAVGSWCRKAKNLTKGVDTMKTNQEIDTTFEEDETTEMLRGKIADIIYPLITGIGSNLNSIAMLCRYGEFTEDEVESMVLLKEALNKKRTIIQRLVLQLDMEIAHLEITT